MATPITITIGTDGSVAPFGGQLIRDGTVIPALPEYEEYAEEIPGYPGRYLFGQDPRMREITLAVNIPKAEAQKASFLRQLAAWLNPVNGEMTLVDQRDLDKQLKVICANPPTYKDAYGMLKMNIPLVGRPCYESRVLNSLTGAGTAYNKGNTACPCTITFSGAATNPSVTIGGVIVSYTGTISAVDRVEIDTQRRTAKYITAGGAISNALDKVNGNFPWLVPNLMTPNQSEVETDTTGLMTYGTCSLARDTTEHHLGAASAKCTATANNDFSVRSSMYTAGILVTPGQIYRFSTFTKTQAALGRKMYAMLIWYDSNGNNISAPTSAEMDCPADWAEIALSGAAPSNAVFAAGAIKMLSGLIGEILWWDTAFFTQGSNVVTTSSTVTITWRDWWV